MPQDNTARTENVNTPRTDDAVIDADMAKPIHERLREARIAAGFSSASAAAENFGWRESGYRHHENGTRPFDADAAKKYGRAFRVDPGYLLGLQSFNPRAVQADPRATTILVTGEVAAGVFKEATAWSPDDQYEITVPSHPLAGVRRWGLRVAGKSMDLVFKEGAVLDCVSIYDVEQAPENGDFVIVERTDATGRREQTVKEYFVDDEGVHWLLPRSSRPEFQAPIRIGKPSENELDESVQVIAFVIGDYQPRNTRFFPTRK